MAADPSATANRGAGFERGRRGRHQDEPGERHAQPLGRLDVEVGLDRPAPLDQEHPGDAAAEDVGADHLAERPPLQVRRQDVAGQNDAVAGAGQAIAQLDVLDRRPGVEPRVEAAEIEEDLAADHPAAGPEGVRGAGVVVEIPLLVHVMVQQVPELADDPGCRRLVVIRAEEGGERGVGEEPRHAAGEGAGVDGHVGVEEEDQGREASWAPRLRAAAGPRGRSCRATNAPIRRASSPERVGRAVVDHDQLVIRPGRVAKPTEAALEVGASVANGDHDRERRPPRLRARRTGGDIVHD